MARFGIGSYGGGGGGFSALAGSAHQQGGFQRGLAQAAAQQFAQNQALLGNQQRATQMMQDQANRDRQFSFQQDQFNQNTAFREREFDRNDARYNAALDLNADRYQDSRGDIANQQLWRQKDHDYRKAVEDARTSTGETRYQQARTLDAARYGDARSDADRNFQRNIDSDKNLENYRKSSLALRAARGGTNGAGGLSASQQFGIGGKLRGQGIEHTKALAEIEDLTLRAEQTSNPAERKILQNDLVKAAAKVQATTPQGQRPIHADRLIDPALEKSYALDIKPETPEEAELRLIREKTSGLPMAEGGAHLNETLSEERWKLGQRYKEWQQENQGKLEVLLNKRRRGKMSKEERKVNQDAIDLIELKLERTRMPSDDIGVTDMPFALAAQSVKGVRDAWKNYWGPGFGGAGGGAGQAPTDEHSMWGAFGDVF